MENKNQDTNNNGIDYTNFTRHLGNVYIAHGEDRAYVLAVTSSGEMYCGPVYVVFRDAQTGEKMNGLLTPSGDTAVIRGENRDRLIVDMTSPLMTRNGQVLS